MSNLSSARPGRACTACGVIGPQHASDADCIAALGAKVQESHAFDDLVGRAEDASIGGAQHPRKKPGGHLKRPA